MLTHILAINTLAVFGFMTLAFCIAKTRNRLDTVDSAWGLGFIVLAWVSVLQQPTPAGLAIFGLVTIWGLRLASHIYARSKRGGEDPRYTEIAKKWKGNYWLRAYISIFLLQGLLILIVGLPITFAATDSVETIHCLGWLTLLGIIVWLKGFVIEAVADKQLSTFKKQKNHPKLLQTGLWKYSRHPNYYGEILQWWGIGIIASQANYGWVGLLGPLVLTLLIVFVSGIPPIEKRKADDKEYQQYKRRTSPLVLWPPRK